MAILNQTYNKRYICLHNFVISPFDRLNYGMTVIKPVRKNLNFVDFMLAHFSHLYCCGPCSKLREPKSFFCKIYNLHKLNCLLPFEALRSKVSAQEIFQICSCSRECCPSQNSKKTKTENVCYIHITQVTLTTERDSNE